MPATQTQPITILSNDHNPISAFKLANGMEVYLIQKPAIPMATVLIAVKNGSYVETPDFNGLAHLYEHMFFKANEKVPSQPEFFKALDEMGIELGPNMNAYTSTESVRYFFTLQSQYLERGIGFMADALITPKFIQDELEKERKVVIGEFDRFEASPSDVFFQKSFFGKMFKEQFVRKNVIGSRPVILSATQAQMHEIQHRYYVPNNSALFVVGEFDNEKAKAWIQNAFGAWPRSEDPFKKWPVPEHPPIAAPEQFIETGPVQSVNIAYGYHGPSYVKNNQDLIALDLASLMLGFESSTFQRELVQSGITSHASFFSWSQRFTSPVMFTVETTPENAQKSYEILNSLVARIRRGNFFTERDLQIAKNATEISSSYDRESGQRYALNLASVWTSTGTLDFYTTYIDAMKKITLAEIDQALKTYLSTNPVVGALMPAGSAPIKFEAMAAAAPAQPAAQPARAP